MFSVELSLGKRSLKIATWPWVWLTQIPSEAVSNQTTLQDEQSPRLLSVSTTRRPFSHCLHLETGIDAFSSEVKALTKEAQSYEGFRSEDLSRKSSVRWGSWGMEHSCDPRLGMRPFSPAGPTRWPSDWWHRRTEDKTGIHCIPTHHKHTHTLMAH